MIDSNYYTDGGALVADPINNLVYYSGGDYYNGVNYQMSVSKSTDGGGMWSRSILTTTGGFTYALAVDPSNTNVVYAGGNPGLFKSTNAGSSWVLSSTGLSGIVNAIGINSVSCNILYAGTTDGVFKSTNGGANWTDCGLDTAQAVLVHPSAPETVFAGTKTGVYRSANSGGSWTAMSAGLDNLDVTSLGINPNFYLFCGTRGCGMYASSLAIGVEEAGGEQTREQGLSVFPNPFSKQLTIHYALSTKDEKAVLRIFDAAGRLVRSYSLSGAYSIVPSVITWYGDDEAGRPVPAGIYFCRLDGAQPSVLEKLIFLR
ncbi:MAG TPA: T9SS type A sorting domain-containing protein [bacterium]